MGGREGRRERKRERGGEGGREPLKNSKLVSMLTRESWCELIDGVGYQLVITTPSLIFFCAFVQFGNTALHEAAWNGNSDIVKILLNSYCFVDSINYSGFTPLHLASQNGHAKVAKTLLKWKADPSLLNQVG